MSSDQLIAKLENLRTLLGTPARLDLLSVIRLAALQVDCILNGVRGDCPAPLRGPVRLSLAHLRRFGAAEDLGNFDYPTYLESPEWRSRRGERLEAAGYRCQVCNGPEELNVHHRTYERIGCERPEDLIVLCGVCHKLFHDHARLVTPVFRAGCSS